MWTKLVRNFCIFVSRDAVGKGSGSMRGSREAVQACGGGPGKTRWGLGDGNTVGQSQDDLAGGVAGCWEKGGPA